MNTVKMNLSLEEVNELIFALGMNKSELKNKIVSDKLEMKLRDALDELNEE